jgi:AcrR family transcriptional regulator
MDTSMPKIIKDAKETIVRQARALLSQNGASKLNMRVLAESAGVAAGTLYNYFPSKEDLIAAVVRDDWVQMLEEVEGRLDRAISAIAGIEMIFNAIAGYREKHGFLWSTIRASKNFRDKQLDYHKEIIEQIADRIRILGMRFGFLSDPTVAPFISEVLLAGGMYPGAKFEYLSPCLKIIVNNRG